MEIRPIAGSQEVEVRVVFRLPRVDSSPVTLLEAEEQLAQRLNAVGAQATQALLQECDTQGEALRCEGRKWTSKGQLPRVVETPHGAVRVLCHVYQTSAGGVTRVPLEERARLVGSATPRLARMLASKLAQMNCGAVTASDLQAYLAQRSDEHLLDYHHAAEYVSEAAAAFAPDQQAGSAAAQAWAARARRVLRERPQGAKSILAQMRRRLRAGVTSADPHSGVERRLSRSIREQLQSAVTYFTNHLPRMNYAHWQARGLPIGSGVTEAACKTLIKQRLCQSGMRWSLPAAGAIISLRALYLTPLRWDYFWKQYTRKTDTL